MLKIVKAWDACYRTVLVEFSKNQYADLPSILKHTLFLCLLGLALK